MSKRFGGVNALDHVSLEIREGEFFCLLGPSGCGKSTLLRLLAGFESPDGGQILLDGADLGPVPPHRRPLNMMFQSYALFPHLSVAANIAYGLKRAGLPRREIGARVDEMLRLVQLDGLGGRQPAQLSGGQRQRVALARALARRPRVLLLDEPLGALDRRLREETQLELKALQAHLGTTFVVVTHDQAEAMTMADRIAVMNHGRIVQAASPREVYGRPADRFVAGFLGDVNLIEGSVAGREDEHWLVEMPVSAAPLRVAAGEGDGFRVGEAVSVAIRPERLVAASESARINRLAGEILDVAYLGSAVAYRLRHASGTILKVLLPASAGELGRAGELAFVTFPPDAAVLLRD